MSSIRSPDAERPATDDADVAAAADAVAERARPLDDSTVAALAEELSGADCVLVGEASHGTGEFYRWRSRLTTRLVADHGFDFVAVEGDWTDCYDVNRYVQGGAERDAASSGAEAGDADARSVLDGFDRWPTWMWANWEVLEFAEWLREHNSDREPPVGFYGLDVYSLHESMDAVVNYLTDVDPEAADRARDAYHCFEPYGDDAREYARSIRLTPESCEDEVVEVLTELRERAGPAALSDEEEFVAEQNALVARNAEAYYRAMVDADANSWNVRDRHMVETLGRLRDHRGPDASAVVWAHNTHVGDARATDMGRRGKVNVGQLAREEYGRENVALVGFGTHRGRVVAADEWGAQMERMPVPPARSGSYEDAFHHANVGDALLAPDDLAAADALAESRGHRAIGVVYHPERELGNYVPTVLPDRYDAFVHVDETTPLHPLHLEPEGATEPETYPWGV